MSKMFSGKPSEHFWEHLKKAKNLGDIKDVIYVLGCLLQEYEDQWTTETKKYSYLRQDDAGHWYLIPQDLLSRYEELRNKTAYCEDWGELESTFDLINSEFSKHRVLGSIENLKIEIE